jgi:hypothetical protein
VLDLLASIVVIVVGATGATGVFRRYPNDEARLLWYAFAGHIVGAVSLILLYTHYYNGGDLTVYHYFGSTIVDAVWADPERNLPALLLAMFQQPNDMSVTVFGGTSSTGTMTAVSAACLLLTGKSLYGVCILVSFISLSGKIMLFEAIAAQLPARYRQRMLVATTLMPSVIFWSSGLMKEAFALFGMGAICEGMRRVIGRFHWGFPIMLSGAWIVALLKPYILFPAVVSCALWFYWARSAIKAGVVVLKPSYLLLGLAGGFAGYALLGAFYPQFSLETLGESAAYQRDVSLAVGGGSDYSLGDTTDASLGGQLKYAPLALITTLFRPTLLEVRNPLMLLSALETTALLWLVGWAAYQRTWTWMFRTVISHPVLLFCTTFACLLAIGVGLGTTNFGTLSRYRIPVVPFFAAVVLLWTGPLPARQTSANAPGLPMGGNGGSATPTVVAARPRPRVPGRPVGGLTTTGA